MFLALGMCSLHDACPNCVAVFYSIIVGETLLAGMHPEILKAEGLIIY